MNAKSKASLVGGRIASVAVARPGSVGAPHPCAPDKAHHDTGLHHPRLGRVRGSDEHIVPGGYGQVPGGHRGGAREGRAGAISLLEGKDFGKLSYPFIYRGAAQGVSTGIPYFTFSG